ncbi:hypothetical protein SPMLV016_A0198, partial [Streptococcus pneumoniae MLV-016]
MIFIEYWPQVSYLQSERDFMSYYSKTLVVFQVRKTP